MTLLHHRICCSIAHLALILGVIAVLPARATAEEWKLDVVHLKNGNNFKGLVLEDSPTRVRLRVVLRVPGRATGTYATTLWRAEVESVELADEKDRDLLAERLKALQTERQNWSALMRAIDPARKNDSSALDELELKPATWGKSGEAVSYQSTHFRVVSNAHKDLVALTAVQLEQIYSAYLRVLPARIEAAKPTTVLLPKSLADYQALLKEQGKTFVNTAYYDAAHNQIVCPSELPLLRDEWLKKFQANQKEKENLDEELAKLKQVFKGNVPANLLKKNTDQQKNIDQINEQNRKICDAQLQKIFRPLYHEAFHAYLITQVYPPEEFQVPRWLNEGLAQLFETAALDAGELQIDRPDKERLLRAQAQLRKGDFVALTSLLKADHKQFLAIHYSEQQNTDRFYLASWALASYLTFDRKLLGKKELDNYARSLQRGTDPLDAFHDLVNQPLADFEKEFRQAVAQWKPEGFVTKGSGK